MFYAPLHPGENGAKVRPIQPDAVLIVASLVHPSVCLFVERLSSVDSDSDLDEDGKESSFHPDPEQFVDASQHVPIRRVSEDGVFRLQISGLVRSSKRQLCPHVQQKVVDDEDAQNGLLGVEPENPTQKCRCQFSCSLKR